LIIEPDPDNPGCATVRVDAAVDGRTYRFILDSGAARTQMRSDAWIDALPSDARHESSGVFTATSADVIVLPSITLGPLTVTDVHAARAELGQSLLAMDVLGAAAIRVDLDRAELTIEASGTASLPWTLDRSPRGHPFLDLRWPDATGRAVFDTGAGITVVDTSFVRAHPDLFTHAGETTGTDSAGTEATTDLYEMAAVTIGDRGFTPTRVAVVDLPQMNGRMDAILGYPTIRQAVWVFDFPANRWGLAARPERKP
jgi:predicted aspartyl protease